VQPGTCKADALLLLAAAIWGAAFVAQRAAMQHMGPLAYNGIRFALGTLVLLPLIYTRRQPADSHPSSQRHYYLWGGLLAGGVLFVGASLQQAGLVYTTAQKAGFITGLYVVGVPILGLLIGQRTPVVTWLGAGLAAIGLYLLSVSGQWEVNPGDWLVLACAAVWSVHVLLIGRLSPRTDPLRLAAIQFAVTAVLSLAAAAVFEHTTLAGLAAAKWAILYGGACSVGIGYTLQVVGQRTAPPAHAGLLMSLEAVFAALTGWWLLSEQLSPRELAGCGIMLAGILLSQARRTLRHEAAVPAPRHSEGARAADA
jgi:drug/metabolite transporter (DMT)-like permease